MERPVWTGQIPDGALQFEVGLSDMNQEAIFLAGNTIQVVAPIPPGEREMLVSYLLPRGNRELRVPIDQRTDHVAVLLGDSTAVLEGDLLALIGVEDLDGIPLHRYEAQDVEAGTTVVLRFGREAPGLGLLLWIMVPAVAVSLLSGFLRWRRVHGAPTPGARQSDPTSLAAEIASLDASYAGREDDEYRRRRAELKERLSKLLEEQG
jgi:hypothetical protein